MNNKRWTGADRQKHRKTKTQKVENTERRKHRQTKTHKDENTDWQKHRKTKTQKDKNTKTQHNKLIRLLWIKLLLGLQVQVFIIKTYLTKCSGVHGACFKRVITRYIICPASRLWHLALMDCFFNWSMTLWWLWWRPLCLFSNPVTCFGYT